MMLLSFSHASFFFFFNDTATTEIYTLSLHDALPISGGPRPPAGSRTSRSRSPASRSRPPVGGARRGPGRRRSPCRSRRGRSEEHTSELQSLTNLVCRLLLEKKNRVRVMQLSRS